MKPILIALLALALCVASARAQDATNTFGPGETFGGYGQILNSGEWVGSRFVPQQTTTITQIRVAIGKFVIGGPIGSPIRVNAFIMLDYLSAPSGGFIWNSYHNSVAEAGVYTFTGPAVTLSQNGVYWLVLQVQTVGVQGMWYLSTSPGANPVSGSANGGTWSALPYNLLAARVLGDAGACCSPITGNCAFMLPATCSSLGLNFVGTAIACGSCAPPPPICPADFDHSGGLSTQDIFDFLNAWFAGCP